MHIHDIFPIMIGSDLDYLECRYPAGLFLFEGIVVAFPYIYTNHRESIHQDFKTGEMILYFYDDAKRGYKIYEINGKIVVRDPEKIETPVECAGDINHPLAKYFSLDRQSEAFDIFKRLTPTLQGIRDNIDSFKNKVLLTPTTILDRSLQMAIKCHVDGQRGNPARDILTTGNIERLISKNIQYAEHSHKKNSYAYRKLQPSTVKRDGLFYSILRPAPKNVPSASTLDSFGFICAAEKNTSLDAHTKTLCGIPGTKILGIQDVESINLPQLLTELEEDGCLVRGDGVPVLLCGGIRSVFNTTWSPMDVFKRVKSFNQFVEVVYEADNFCMISVVEGLTFTKLDDFFVSTRELDLYFPSRVVDCNLFGPNVYKHVIEDGGYLNVSRLMSGVNYSKNRFGSTDLVKYFTTTSENYCAYISDERFDRDTETLKADVVFSSHPQLCADGIIVNAERPILGTIIFRSRFEMEIPNKFVYQPINTAPIVDYDKCGNAICKIYPIAKFQKRGAQLKIKIFKQNNFFYTTQKHSDSWTVFLYKVVEDREGLDADETSVTVYSTKTKLYIDFYAKRIGKTFDGVKLSDQCAQKGLTMLQDVSMYEKYLDKKPDVVMSLLSVIGRNPIHQCKQVLRNSIHDGDILHGNYNFDVLKNTAFSMIANGKVKFDSQMKSVLSVNGMAHLIRYFEKESLDHKYRDCFLPPDSEIPMSIINIIKTFVKYIDENGNEYESLNVNRFDNDDDFSIKNSTI